MTHRISNTKVLLSVATVVTILVAGACSDDKSPAQPVPTRTVVLAQIAGSTVSGTATIQNDGGPTSTVRVDLSGMTPNSAHAGHVHTGSCLQQGAILHGLQVVSAGADGRGSIATSGVPDSLLASGYYIQYHISVTPPGAPIACGDLAG